MVAFTSALKASAKDSRYAKAFNEQSPAEVQVKHVLFRCPCAYAQGLLILAGK